MRASPRGSSSWWPRSTSYGRASRTTDPTSTSWRAIASGSARSRSSSTNAGTFYASAVRFATPAGIPTPPPSATRPPSSTTGSSDARSARPLGLRRQVRDRMHRRRDGVDRHVARACEQLRHRRHVGAVGAGREVRVHGLLAPPRTDEHQLGAGAPWKEDLEAHAAFLYGG